MICVIFFFLIAHLSTEDLHQSWSVLVKLSEERRKQWYSRNPQELPINLKNIDNAFVNSHQSRKMKIKKAVLTIFLSAMRELRRHDVPQPSKYGLLFFFCDQHFFYLFLHTTSQHNIHSKQTKQNNRHILNILRVQSKGRKRGREKEKQKTKSFLYIRGHQVRSWRAGVPAEFSSNPNQTHLKQLIKVLLGILETSRQVC